LRKDLAQQFLQKSCQGDLAHGHLLFIKELVETTLVSLRRVPCKTVLGFFAGMIFVFFEMLARTMFGSTT
jgi:hypothetical protein